MPTEPPAPAWLFPDLSDPEVDASCSEDVVAMGADLAPGTVLAAYRAGLFPMREGAFARGEAMAWWSPVMRGVLPLDQLRVSRSLARSCRQFEIRIDTRFEEVVAGCADPARDGGWIDEDIVAAYSELHRFGWAHSVEAWQGDELMGGLYGVAIGGLFAGESMFHRVRDASKVALVALVDLLADEHRTSRLVDVQWSTPHLESLGVMEIPRATYLDRLRTALDVPLPAPWR